MHSYKILNVSPWCTLTKHHQHECVTLWLHSAEQHSLLELVYLLLVVRQAARLLVALEVAHRLDDGLAQDVELLATATRTRRHHGTSEAHTSRATSG